MMEGKKSPSSSPSSSIMRGKTKMWFFRRLRRESWRCKFLWSSFRGKRLNLPAATFMRDVVFKIVSVLEAIVLVLTLCFFYFCFGCHF